jgi:hypothetical protein
MRRAACRNTSGSGLGCSTSTTLNNLPSNRGSKPVDPKVSRIFSGSPLDATQYGSPPRIQFVQHRRYSRNRLQVTVESFESTPPVLIEKTIRRCVPKQRADLGHALRHRPPQEPRVHVVQRYGQAQLIEHPGEDRVRQRLAVDQHAVTVEDHQIRHENGEQNLSRASYGLDVRKSATKPARRAAATHAAIKTEYCTQLSRHRMRAIAAKPRNNP